VLTDLVNKLYPFNYSVTGSGNDSAISELMEQLDFEVLEWPSGSELNGWIIPQAQRVDKAVIWLNDRLVYDATVTSLGVQAQSESFQGEISLEKLLPHLFSDPERPEVVPAHWSRLYTRLDQKWGICIPDKLKESLEPGNYRIDLQSSFEPGTMKVLSYVLPGESEDTWLFNAHNCHPYQANDDVSGMAAGIDLIHRLGRIKNRKFSYQLLIAPELFGPMFWLDSLDPDQASKIRGAVMLKSVGNTGALRLQQSFDSKSLICRAANTVFEKKYNEFETGVFRSIYGNDETVFESPPFRIPSISITRWPFDEYHTNLDTPDRIDENSLQDTVDTSVKICEELEMAGSYAVKFKGLPNLSRHNLYLSLPGTQFEADYASTGGRWHRLMNTLPSLLSSGLIVSEIAKEFDLPENEISDYIERWINAGLIEKH
jgi:aminopeptidase-like protein